MTDNSAGQSEHTHGFGSHSKHLNQPALDSDADLAEESKPFLYLFAESNYYSFNSVATANIASSVESEDPAEDPSSDDDPDPTGGAPDHWQFTSSTFLEIIHHPHSGIKEPEFIFCDLSSAGLEENFAFQSQHCLGGKPWAPFHT